MAKVSPGAYDRLFKVVLLGDAKVGKSSFLSVHADGTYDRTYTATIGVDFKISVLKKDEESIKMQLWDTAGEERFQTIVNAYYRGAMGFIYMFDLTDEKSFQNLESRWHSSVEHHSSGNMPVIVVGNKVDLLATSERVMDSDTAKEFARQINGKYMEVSCSNKATVDAAVMALVDMMMERNPVSRPTTMRSTRSDESLKIEEIPDSSKEEGKKCCNIS